MGAVAAESLPQLNEKPWLGWFAGMEAKGLRFGIMPDGEGVLIPMKSKNEDGSKNSWIRIEPVIEEVMPDGKVVSKKIDPDGFTPLTESSVEAEEMAYQATVTGGAKFEAHFAVDRDEITAGGKILENGELKNPLRLVFRVKIPNGYEYVKEMEDLEDKAKRDKLNLVLVDRSKLKVGSLEEVSGEELTGVGIASADIDFDGLKSSGIELETGTSGVFRLETSGDKAPLYKGFTMAWVPDPEKDPEGKSRFTLTYK